MSRMSKYLNQTCVFEAVKVDSEGNPFINEYGELQYESPKNIRCRREQYYRDVEIPSGSLVRSSNQFYTVEQVKINDKLDSKVILTSEEYTDSRGRAVGFRSIA